MSRRDFYPTRPAIRLGALAGRAHLSRKVREEASRRRQALAAAGRRGER
jgi:hypothetical protein